MDVPETRYARNCDISIAYQVTGERPVGIGNFKALFEAIEREQALRGNL